MQLTQTCLGIFFLYFQARLHTSQCEPVLANRMFRFAWFTSSAGPYEAALLMFPAESLQRALDLDLEYVQLQHMCLVRVHT